MCCGGILCWSSGGGSHCAWTEGDLTEKGSHARLQGCGTWGKQTRQPVLGLSCSSQVAPCLGWGRGDRNSVYWQFVPGEAFLWMLPLRDVLQEEWITSPLPAQGTPSCCTICPRVVPLPLLQDQSNALRALSHHAHQPLKFQSSSPTGGKNSRKSAPLIFPASDFGKCSPCA